LKKVLILAGGFGSRLKSVVYDVPKPLAPVCGKPFLIYLIENYISQGAKEFVLLLHYEAYLIQSTIRNFFLDSAIYDVKISFIIENEPLGTGGSILNAINILNISESFLVVNGDTWIGNGLAELNSSDYNSIAAVEINNTSRYGTLILKNNKITKFLEKNLLFDNGVINAGLYHLHPNIFSNLENNSKCSLESDIFVTLVEDFDLNAIKLSTEFIDIGVPEDYFKFCAWVKSGRTIEL
jgi:NDP-sugar pyrophosphorylase family protein